MSWSRTGVVHVFQLRPLAPIFNSLIYINIFETFSNNESLRDTKRKIKQKNHLKLLLKWTFEEIHLISLIANHYKRRSFVHAWRAPHSSKMKVTTSSRQISIKIACFQAAISLTIKREQPLVSLLIFIQNKCHIWRTIWAILY